ncbi:hypothetical protein EBN88_28765 [Streptomyces triticirhizae]|uniref:Uncharacterized protein n=1 Tax=Streptomyces triticirhizae TaxID=2483353 RepID=A0A3M2L016_9ACTN|nr:hypothetical protein EBN88_28765 [Streptomyces triticirhizae]
MPERRRLARKTYPTAPATATPPPMASAVAWAPPSPAPPEPPKPAWAPPLGVPAVAVNVAVSCTPSAHSTVTG